MCYRDIDKNFSLNICVSKSREQTLHRKVNHESDPANKFANTFSKYSLGAANN